MGLTPKLLRAFKKQSSKVEVLLDLKVKLIQGSSKAKKLAFFGGANLQKKKKKKKASNFFPWKYLCVVFIECALAL